jgi:hypothetical protein
LSGHRTSAPQPKTGILLVERVGVRIYLDVGGKNAPGPNFSINSLTAQRAADGHPRVLAQIHNTGGRALDLSGTLSLSHGPGALSAGPFAAVLGTTLAPGDTENITVDLDKQLPDGPWQADLVVRSGLVEKSARATITFPHSPGTGPAVRIKKAASSVLVYALPLSGGAGLVLLIGLAIVLRRRKRENDHPSAHRR